MRVTKCPKCGTTALTRVIETFSFRVRGKRKVVPNVPRLRCTSCAEELFDQESNRIIDLYRVRRSTKGAA